MRKMNVILMTMKSNKRELPTQSMPVKVIWILVRSILNNFTRAINNVLNNGEQNKT